MLNGLDKIEQNLKVGYFTTVLENKSTLPL